jgi:hypothetical protein
MPGSEIFVSFCDKYTNSKMTIVIIDSRSPFTPVSPLLKIPTTDWNWRSHNVNKIGIFSLHESLKIPSSLWNLIPDL